MMMEFQTIQLLALEVFCPPTAGFINDVVCVGDPTNFVDVSSPGDGTPPLNTGSHGCMFGDADPPNAVTKLYCYI